MEESYSIFLIQWSDIVLKPVGQVKLQIDPQCPICKDFPDWDVLRYYSHCQEPYNYLGRVEIFCEYV